MLRRTFLNLLIIAVHAPQHHDAQNSLEGRLPAQVQFDLLMFAPVGAAWWRIRAS